MAGPSAWGCAVKTTIDADDVAVDVSDDGVKCGGCGGELEWDVAHSVLECLQELQLQIAELRGVK